MALLNVATVTIALLQILQQDAPLRVLMPDGAWFAEAPSGSTRFVILSLVSSAEVPMFGGPAYKDTVYLVEARALMTSGADVEQAFARITTLLTDADLVIPGYAAMLSQFEEELEIGRSRRHRSLDSLEPLRRPSARDGRRQLVDVNPRHPRGTRYGSTRSHCTAKTAQSRWTRRASAARPPCSSPRSTNGIWTWPPTRSR